MDGLAISTTTTPISFSLAGDGGQKKDTPKPLRFVTNYGAPRPKRRRIGAACLTCRKRKTACSGERPFCSTCNQNKLECAGYSPDAPPPTKQADITSRQREQPRPDALASRAAPYKVPSSDGFVLPGVSPGQLAVAAELEGDTLREEEPLFSGPRNRMPYFRWLGPTAIMPGFKQMVVKVKLQDTDPMPRSSASTGLLPPTLNNLTPTVPRGAPPMYSNTPAAMESGLPTPLNLRFYDNSTNPPSDLITHLVQTFFTHLGCNYPFLQQARFLRDLNEKQVDAILVDAVCALAARFSTDSLLTQQPADDHNKPTPAEYGHAFAQRAKTALVDTFTCPSVAAVQAALLLAYNEFGESRDSGLWMYLGISIRMAQDLGMHKLEGLKYEGKDGPTPKMIKQESMHEDPYLQSPGKKVSDGGAEVAVDPALSETEEAMKEREEQKAVEQERVDTFWAVFFLDRVVSSGTGRRSTLRDKDIELSFPRLDERDPKSGWPALFPALIRIVHLYGRVADLLNSLKEPTDITTNTPKRLAAMESQVTRFYRGLSSKLHFDAVNFQHYMKAGEGTNFVLLHFWFHTLIVLLHQPTLLMTFSGKMLQLFPNSQQLSMSSAKTIADILSYSQLMDAKAILGNPFTTQPIYIAACAFLKETAQQTANSSNTQSTANSPSRNENEASSEGQTSGNGTPESSANKASISGGLSNGMRTPTLAINHQKMLEKHTLLATAASQHYQLCYKALQSLETYWSGTKYILTVLDQKYQGVGDPLLYTVEEGESSMERPRPVPAFTIPGWRRKVSWGPYLENAIPFLKTHGSGQMLGNPCADPAKAIGWSLTGTTNSPSTNLACHYSAKPPDQPSTSHFQAHDYDPAGMNGQFPQRQRTTSGDAYQTMPLQPHPSQRSNIPNADADLLLSLNSPSPSGIAPQATPASGRMLFQHQASSAGGGNFAVQNPIGGMPPFNTYDGPSIHSSADMMIEQQEFDMSSLGLNSMPWFTTHDSNGDMLIGGFDPGGDQAYGGAAQLQTGQT